MENLLFFLSKRYLRHRREEKFLSIISTLSIIGIVLGVMALIIVISVMNGFDRDLKTKMLGTMAPITVGDINGKYLLKWKKLAIDLKKLPYVKAVAPSIDGFGLIQSKYANEGIYIKGVDISKEKNVTKIVKNVIVGRFPEKKGEILLGKILARNLGVWIGDEVVLVTKVIQTPTGYKPKFGRAKIVGFFDSGLYSFDSSTAVISLDFARELFVLPKNSVQYLKIKIEDPFYAPFYAKKIRKFIMKNYESMYFVQSWDQVNKQLFQAIALEKTVMFLILSLIIIVAAFNIVSSQYMTVIQKTKEIGILKAMGLTNKEVAKIFFYQGIIIGFIGIALGSFLGISLSYIVGKYKLIPLPGYVYDLTALPVAFSPVAIILINVSAMIICILATLYPAYKASKLNPVEALKYE